MKYGYFICGKGKFGDSICSEMAEQISLNISLQPHTVYDGVSVWENPDRTLTVRVCALNFFNGEKFSVFAKDLKL